MLIKSTDVEYDGIVCAENQYETIPHSWYIYIGILTWWLFFGAIMDRMPGTLFQNMFVKSKLGVQALLPGTASKLTAIIVFAVLSFGAAVSEEVRNLIIIYFNNYL